MAMSKKDLIELARTAVPDHLKPKGKIVERPPQMAAVPTLGAPVHDDEHLRKELAKELGIAAAELAAEDEDSADVEFTEHGPTRTRGVVVQIRGGKVHRVITNG